MISTDEVKKDGKYIPGLYVQQHVVELWTGAVQEKLWNVEKTCHLERLTDILEMTGILWCLDFIFPSAFSSRLMS